MSEEVTACGSCRRACAVAPDVHLIKFKNTTQKHPDLEFLRILFANNKHNKCGSEYKQ